MCVRLLSIVCLVLLCGCEYAIPNKESVRTDDSTNQRERQSSKDVSSDYVVAQPAENLTGINGGDRFQFEPPSYSGEFTIAKNGDLVQFFVLDETGKKNVAVYAESFFIKSGDNQIFMLDPDADNKLRGSTGSHASSSFSLEDRNLALAMNSPVEVVMSVEGRSYRAFIDNSQSSLATAQDTTVAD